MGVSPAGWGERGIFVVTAPGLEQVAAREIAELGMRGVVEAGGVAVVGGEREILLLNLHLRSASRVLMRIAAFRARTFFELERHAAKVDWRACLPVGHSVRLNVTSRKSRLYHQRAIEERLLRAIDAPANASGAVDPEAEGEGEQLFVVRFVRDECVISADTSGTLLHRRGYRQALGRAPLRETLAAAMLLASGWDGRTPLLDPLCGSGTIPIEAALMARRIPPGLASPGFEPRDFAVTDWPGFDQMLLEREVTRAREAILPKASVPVTGADRDAGVIEAARANAARAGVADDVGFQVRPLSAAEPGGGGGWVVTNPPYGVRVGRPRPLRDLYAALGRVASAVAAGGRLVMLSADPALEGQLGIPMEDVLHTRNGGIAVRVVAGRPG